MPADSCLLADLRNQDVNSILPKKQREVGEPLLSIKQHLQCANHQQWAGYRVPELQLFFASSHTQLYLPIFHCIDDWSLPQVILHTLLYAQSLGKVAFSKEKCAAQQHLTGCSIGASIPLPQTFLISFVIFGIASKGDLCRDYLSLLRSWICLWSRFLK